MKGKKRVGRPGITQVEVELACDALVRQGREIGPQNVRLELGKGSYSTIISFLRKLGHSPTTGKRNS